MVADIRAYAGVTKRIEALPITLRDDPVISSGQIDSFIYELVDGDGTVLDTGPMAHDDDAPGTWYAEANVPDRPGETIHVHAIATKGTSVGKWHGTISVKRFA